MVGADRGGGVEARGAEESQGEGRRRGRERRRGGRGGDGSGGVETGAPWSWRRETERLWSVCVLSDTKRCRLRDKTALVLSRREANWLNWPQVSFTFSPT